MLNLGLIRKSLVLPQAMKNIILFLKGLAMGAADVIPGVSGGTIAFLTGIYDTLLDSIQKVRISSFKIWQKEGFPSFWKHINGSFLLVLVAGIGTSIFSLAKVFTYLLQTFPVPVWSFFFGLIIAGIVVMFKGIENKNLRVYVSFILGTALSFYVTIATPAQGPDALWYIFLCGAIAICAMILPGISGSFILLLLGAYHTVLEAVSSFKISILLVFMTGAITGLLSFSGLIKYLLDKFRGIAIAILTGFMAGSLNKVWPWKQVVLTRKNSKGIDVAYLDQNVWPTQYQEVSEGDALIGMTNKDPMLFAGILLFIIGIVIVAWMSKVDQKNKNLHA
jgi:putative membrane protein